MPSAVSPILENVERIRRQLTKYSSRQLHSKRIKDDIRTTVESYFRDVRSSISGASPDRLAEIDSEMRSLLDFCHLTGATSKYRDALGSLKQRLIQLDSHLVTEQPSGSDQGRTAADIAIIETLKRLVPSAAAAYEQALRDLSADTRLSWRGPATDLREALRETLDYLAPDKDVEQSQGYKQVQGTHGPTMKQKVRYILRTRETSKALVEPAENAADAIEEVVGKFVRSVYTRSSVSTHTPTERGEVVRVWEFVRVVLCDLLEIRR